MRPPGRRAAAVLVALAVGVGASLPVAASDGAPQARHKHKRVKRCKRVHRHGRVVRKCTKRKKRKPATTTTTTDSVPSIFPFPPVVAGGAGGGSGGAGGGGGVVSGGDGGSSGGGATSDPGSGTTTTTTPPSDPGTLPEDPCGTAVGVAARDRPPGNPPPFAFSLTRPCVHAGSVAVYFDNLAMDTHNHHLRPAGGGGPDYAFDDLNPGGHEHATFDLSSGTWHLYCSLPGHEDPGGMSRDIDVR
jgi:hypothetical protein